MTIDANNIGFILGVVGVLSVIFAVYRYFRDPQVQSENTDSLFALQLKTMQADLVNLRDNHIHSLDMKLESTNANLASLTIAVAKLTTIIDERIPRK